MTQCNGPTVRVHPWVVIGKAQRARCCQRLCGKRFVQFYHIHLVDAEICPIQYSAARRDWPDPHDPGRDPGGGHADNAGHWSKAVGLGRRFGRDNQRGCPVVHAAGIASRDGQVWPIDAFELGEVFNCCVGARVFVRLHDQRVAFALRDLDWNDFVSKYTCRPSSRAFGLRRGGKDILISAADVIVGSNVISRFGHGVCAIGRAHRRIDKAPANGCVVYRIAAGERAGGFRHHEGCATHAFDAASDGQVVIARLHAACSKTNRIHTAGTEAVDGAARNGVGKPGKKDCHAGDVAVIFACLVGAAEYHLVNRGRVETRVARHQSGNGQRGQIVGADRGKTAAVAADWRAHAIANIRVLHWFNPSVRLRVR